MIACHAIYRGLGDRNETRDRERHIVIYTKYFLEVVSKHSYNKQTN